MWNKKDLRGTWFQAILSLLFPVVFIFGIRWAFIEPYVIPSGSMIPSLLVHDYILVNKFAYGLRWPFTEKWMTWWGSPQRGDVVVFKYPQDPEVFYIKRAIAIGGDVVDVKNQVISVNGQEYKRNYKQDLDGAQIYLENNGNKKYLVQLHPEEILSDFGPFTVPDGELFVMGDNRDQSYDSRFWGTVPEKNLLGRAKFIWMSCDETLPSMSFMCDPKTLRVLRMFKTIE